MPERKMYNFEPVTAEMVDNVFANFVTANVSFIEYFMQTYHQAWGRARTSFGWNESTWFYYRSMSQFGWWRTDPRSRWESDSLLYAWDDGIFNDEEPGTLESWWNNPEFVAEVSKQKGGAYYPINRDDLSYFSYDYFFNPQVRMDYIKFAEYGFDVKQIVVDVDESLEFANYGDELEPPPEPTEPVPGENPNNGTYPTPNRLEYVLGDKFVLEKDGLFGGKPKYSTNWQPLDEDGKPDGSVRDLVVFYAEEMTYWSLKNQEADPELDPVYEWEVDVQVVNRWFIGGTAADPAPMHTQTWPKDGADLGYPKPSAPDPAPIWIQSTDAPFTDPPFKSTWGRDIIDYMRYEKLLFKTTVTNYWPATLGNATLVEHGELPDYLNGVELSAGFDWQTVPFSVVYNQNDYIDGALNVWSAVYDVPVYEPIWSGDTIIGWEIIGYEEMPVDISQATSVEIIEYDIEAGTVVVEIEIGPLYIATTVPPGPGGEEGGSPDPGDPTIFTVDLDLHNVVNWIASSHYDMNSIMPDFIRSVPK